MYSSHILGFPRIGFNRELKFCLEKYWGSNTGPDERSVFETRRSICNKNWRLQKLCGLDYITVGDFALYDHVLSTLTMVGGLPRRFWSDDNPLQTYFKAARGSANCSAMEMKKWFNTNYHYMVPEYTPNMNFNLKSWHLFEEVELASDLAHPMKVNLLGPVTLLWLGKEYDGLISRTTLLPSLLETYKDILLELRRRKVEWVQMEEPVACLNISDSWREALQMSYNYLSGHFNKILLTTYFTFSREAANVVFKLPVAGVHLDITKNFSLDSLKDCPTDLLLSVGIVDGRSVWRNDIPRSVHKIKKVRDVVGTKRVLWISSGCSLLHVPYDTSLEDRIEESTKERLAFGVQKMEEIVRIKTALQTKPVSQEQTGFFRTSKPAVSFNVEELSNCLVRNREDNILRAAAQQETLKLPALPTTTVGSFPQTENLRSLRSNFKSGAVSVQEYVGKLRAEIGLVINKQLEYGLDVLVHGEVERNDMVEYFGESLDGFAITKKGWVQSYGSRCTKPPIIVNDIAFVSPITAYWFEEAQNHTTSPVKGMLTGPVTIQNWTFTRNDLSFQEVTLQIAFALRIELGMLEARGMKIVQIDEPAIREGLPLESELGTEYLDWITQIFGILCSCLSIRTQVHSHMCYSEFDDIITTIAKLPADVLSVEAARSNMLLLQSFKTIAYTKGLGLGVYDIHSPEVPSLESMKARIKHIINCLPQGTIWINPDCGLKTRTWDQVAGALRNMVEATKSVRMQLAKQTSEPEHPVSINQ